MADFFRSAFDYLNSAATSQDNDFVGQYVELGNQKLRVKSVIAEGRCMQFLTLRKLSIYIYFKFNLNLVYIFLRRLILIHSVCTVFHSSTSV